MKKLLCILIFTCLACFAFTQNAKPYVVDLSGFPYANNERTAIYNTATKTITIKQNIFMATTTDIKNGLCINFNNDIYTIVEELV